MARKTSFVNLAIRMARAAEVDQRRAYNASVREHNAMVRQMERERKQNERERIVQEKEDAIQYAFDKTNEAENYRKEIQSILESAITEAIIIDWNEFKRYDNFPQRKPNPIENKALPLEVDEKLFKIKRSFIDKIFKKQYEKRVHQAEGLLENARRTREKELQETIELNEEITSNNEKILHKWIIEKEQFDNEQKDHNNGIDNLKQQYYQSENEAVEFYFDSVLNKMDLPEYYEIQWNIQYENESQILLIDVDLPSKDEIPNLKVMKYIQTRKEFTETTLKDKEIDSIYETILFQLSLRITNDVYISDLDNKIKSIVFNGMYTGISKSTGNEETKCILSLQTQKPSFESVNIRNVDPKACFMKFKGVASSKLADIVAIAPILSMNREDHRFVESKEVANKINGQNLAAMDWEEFEHLIRELFEKEFAINGAEIKITQASRDGGVDAVMFDPDPIRGGKYIIQAKRYTNIVGVSAVRDLYGTIMNEGAVKGILVTTANYGSDSYEFAKDKPITLISGGNLLHMLQKHGYNARIDIDEAKKLLGNSN